uniref:Fatty acid hydroxylase domain-containing protein n=1 Tax=Athene cunicularia TaxID=194338 RepID=A0A663MW45_ATHCN
MYLQDSDLHIPQHCLLPTRPLHQGFTSIPLAEFQLAAWGSLLTYQGSYSLGPCQASSTQVMPAMKKYEIQLDKPETWEEQWKYDFNIPYDWDSMPPWCYMLLKTPRLSKMDTWTYFMHRLMHHKTFYLYFHKLHHECKPPFALHSLYISLGGHIVTGAGIFTAIHIFCKHILMAWVWFTALILKTVDTRK